MSSPRALRLFNIPGVSGGLISHDDDGGIVPCSACGADAAGPCARCRSPVCGDCCVLTTGSSSVWAICLRCDRKAGRSLRAGWLVVIGWIAKPILILLVVVLALQWFFGR